MRAWLVTPMHIELANGGSDGPLAHRHDPTNDPLAPPQQAILRLVGSTRRAVALTVARKRLTRQPSSS